MLPAWQMGAVLATMVQNHQGLTDKPLADTDLTRLAGIPVEAVQSGLEGPGTYWDTTGTEGVLVLQPAHRQARRWALARLVGDSCLGEYDPNRRGQGGLLIATGMDTYRQKAQLGFAGQLLCPLEAVQDFLQEDYSATRLHQAAIHFAVPYQALVQVVVNQGLADSTGQQASTVDGVHYSRLW